MTTVRAKFRCNSVEMYGPGPTEVLTYKSGQAEPTGAFTWPRTYRFNPAYDPDVPEDQRYATATPSGELTLRVDNPNVEFEPGQHYYLDFTPVPA